MSAGPPTIILVTSAPPGKDEYRRDFLTCMAAPDGQWASFTYRTRWIDEPLRHDTRLDGRGAILVFADVPNGVGTEFEFVAFRHAIVRGIRPSEVVRRRLYDENTTYLGVDFQLGPHVHIAPKDLPTQVKQWTTTLRSLDHRPRPHGHEVKGTTRFMFALDDPPAESERLDSETSWRMLSEWLAERQSLDGSYFFRVRGLRSSGRANHPLRPSTDGGRLHFELQTRGEYFLELDAYAKAASPPFADAVEALATSDRLLVDNPQTATLGTGGRATIALTAGPVQTAVHTTMVLRGRTTLEDRAPRLELPMRIVPRRTLIWSLVCMIALGTALSGLSKSDLGVSTAIAVAIKATGVMLIVVALFLASGRAPGVSK